MLVNYEHSTNISIKTLHSRNDDNAILGHFSQPECVKPIHMMVTKRDEQQFGFKSQYVLYYDMIKV